jgi:hypothetical protein
VDPAGEVIVLGPHVNPLIGEAAPLIPPPDFPPMFEVFSNEPGSDMAGTGLPVSSSTRLDAGAGVVEPVSLTGTGPIYIGDPIGGVVGPIDPNTVDSGLALQADPLSEQGTTGEWATKAIEEYGPGVLTDTASGILKSVVENAAPGELAPGAEGLAEGFGPVASFGVEAALGAQANPSASGFDVGLQAAGKAGAGFVGEVLLGPVLAPALGPMAVPTANLIGEKSYDALNSATGWVVDNYPYDPIPDVPSAGTPATPDETAFPMDGPTAPPSPSNYATDPIGGVSNPTSDSPQFGGDIWTPPAAVEQSYTPAPPVEQSFTPAPPVEQSFTPAPPVEQSFTPAPTAEQSFTPAPTTEQSFTPAPPVEQSFTPAPTTEQSFTPAPPVEQNSNPTPVEENTTPAPPQEHSSPEPAAVGEPNAESASPSADPVSAPSSTVEHQAPPAPSTEANTAAPQPATESSPATASAEHPASSPVAPDQSSGATVSDVERPAAVSIEQSPAVDSRPEVESVGADRPSESGGDFAGSNESSSEMSDVSDA